GMSWLTALLPTLDATAITQRLDVEARSLPNDDTRSHDQACADLLAGLLLGSPDPDEKTGGVRTVIGITVPVTSLMGLSQIPGELADGSASIPAALIRERALEPGTLFHRLLTDPHGRLLDATHLGRFAPEKIRTALWFRDHTTAFPTSTVAAGRCDVDHLDPWPAPTTGSNLQPLHRQAHRLKTMGYYSVRRRGTDTEWTTHTGHTHRHQPDPLPIEQWPEPRPDQWPPRQVSGVTTSRTSAGTLVTERSCPVT
ncbi:HNH endonuclease signature motif containing protein, partial [Aeromicrobium sp. CF4.19]|uniref:HNH endonuclease signature motif containing protein n=1 Tax=Aeromicrobium sp. CF4.19 TaxID=3373082 RepID=UPI003EE7BD18